MKVWCYYLLETRGLYAVTPNKDLAKIFESQRCMSVFLKKVLHLDNCEFSAFLATNKNNMLVESPLFNGSLYINMALTISEDSQITYEIERLMDEVTAIKIKWMQDDTIPKKLRKLVVAYLDLFLAYDTDDKGMHPISNIDAFHVCYLLFRNTFEDGGVSRCDLDVNPF